MALRFQTKKQQATNVSYVARAHDTNRRTSEVGEKERRARLLRGLRNGFLLLLTLLACGVPVLLVASPISYVPFITVVLMVLASFLYLQILKHTFSFSEDQLARSCERGTTVRLNVVLSNKSPFPHPYIDVSFCISDLFEGNDAVRHVSASLGAFETSNFSFDAQFSHVGRYSAGIDSVVLHDLLGLFQAKIDCTLCHQVIVRPRLFDFPGVELTDANESAAQMMRAIASTDSIDYSSVREYRYGDPLKTVHWNLTSRSAEGTMYTRLYEEFVSPSLSIIIDPFSDVSSTDDLMSTFDGIIESAASFARFAQSEGVDCTVRYAARNYEYTAVRLSTMADTEQLVLSAQRIASVSDGRPQMALPLEMLNAEANSQQRVGNVAFVTGRVSQDIIQLLSVLSARRIRPLLIVCVPASFVGPDRKKYLTPLHQLSARGIPYFIMESNEQETRGVTQ